MGMLSSPQMIMLIINTEKPATTKRLAGRAPGYRHAAPHFTRRASRLFCARRLACSSVIPRLCCKAWKFSVT